MTLPAGFAFLDERLPGIRWDAKYATSDNFTGRPVEGYEVNRIVGTWEMCLGLERARHAAESRGLGLLVWDAYRPQRAVDSFLRWARQPEDGLTTGRHYPNIDRSDIVDLGYVAARSGHSRGSAVDLTLVDLVTGRPVPMGGRHDLMDPISHHGAMGISPAETKNRLRLRSIMRAGGFEPFEQEWWHYSLAEEPYPDTYFDFCVG